MHDNKEIAAIRKVYQLESLLENDVHQNPVQQFENWWLQAIKSHIEEPNAMTLATCGSSGIPAARIVLLKGITSRGFVFYTNYDSRKGKEIAENARVSLLFFWKEMERQVRIEGKAEKVSSEESDAYFYSRPRESRIGAWSSPQSQVIESRRILDENVKNMELRFPDENVPRPTNWGGFEIVPFKVEFWQGRPGRLHDRLQYILTENDHWKIQRLAP